MLMPITATLIPGQKLHSQVIHLALYENGVKIGLGVGWIMEMQRYKMHLCGCYSYWLSRD